MGNRFFGWYFKCQGDGGTLSVIPAFHKNGKNSTCSIQIITDDGAWNVTYPASLWRRRRGFGVDIGKNAFGREGYTLDVSGEGITANGSVRFGSFTPLRSDIMGPFRFIPFLQCRHSVISMLHTVDGEITVNGRRYLFEGGRGYVEGDRGRSFPEVYAWTHGFTEGGSVMLSVASIPFGLFRFTGIIGAVYEGGREYRIATYRGARPQMIEGGKIVIRQGKKTLTAEQLTRSAHPLNAPVSGAMIRTIRESAACRARYRLTDGEREILSFECPVASFEYEFPN